MARHVRVSVNLAKLDMSLDIVNPDIVNPDMANLDMANPDMANPDMANPEIVNLEMVKRTTAKPATLRSAPAGKQSQISAADQVLLAWARRRPPLAANLTPARLAMGRPALARIARSVSEVPLSRLNSRASLPTVTRRGMARH